MRARFDLSTKPSLAGRRVGAHIDETFLIPADDPAGRAQIHHIRANTLAVPITLLLLQHGRAQQADVEEIAHALQAFAIGLPFFSVFQLLTRTFYAMQDTRTPAIVNVGAPAVVNVGANLLFLSFGWGV